MASYARSARQAHSPLARIPFPRLNKAVALALLALGTAAISTPAAARVVKLEVVSVEPAFAGRSFGKVGAYERVVARASYAVNPQEARNAGIVDLSRAPRNAQGEVEFAADVEILRPQQGAQGNGRWGWPCSTMRPTATVPARPKKPAMATFSSRATPWFGAPGSPTCSRATAARC
jgi:hypothetical protein